MRYSDVPFGKGRNKLTRHIAFLSINWSECEYSRVAATMASIDLKRRKKWKKTKPYNSPKPEDLKLVAGSWKVSLYDIERYEF